jgi:hypothetical protein
LITDSVGAHRPRNRHCVSSIYKYYLAYRRLTEQQDRRDAAKRGVDKGSGEEAGAVTSCRIG